MPTTIDSPSTPTQRKPAGGVARFVVQGNFDGARSATVEIDRARGMVTVRPYRRRQKYGPWPLADLAERVVWLVVKSAVATRK